MFKEFQANWEAAQAEVEKIQAKVDATDAVFQVEKAGKEARDLADAAKEAERIFNERSAERKTQFDQLNGTATDAKKDLDDNLAEIQNLEAQL